MSRLRLRSAESPFDDPTVAAKAARLLGLAEAMGVLPGKGHVEHLDRRLLLETLEALVSEGVASDAYWTLAGEHLEGPQLADLVDAVRRQLLESPLPQTEIPALVDLLGIDDAAALVGAGSSSLRRYLSGTRQPPAAVVWRAHTLALITAELAGSYNDHGIRRWFHRPRQALGGRTPAEVLSGDWDADCEEARAVLELARTLSGTTVAA